MRQSQLSISDLARAKRSLERANIGFTDLYIPFNKEEKKMKKNPDIVYPYTVHRADYGDYETFEEATNAAKQRALSTEEKQGIFKLVAETDNTELLATMKIKELA